MFIPNKYQAFESISLENRQWPSKTITEAPRWCSVDLRDGNQALINPMSRAQKMRFFEILVQAGFKEIEIGFPSASQIEFDFSRDLIDGNRIPDDVSIQILTQAREHLIARSFEAVKGSKRAIIHVYNSTSPAQREVVFRKSPKEIIDIAKKGVRQIKELSRRTQTEIVLEYSPESFSQTELPFAKDICDAVIDTWMPQGDEKVIINLPSTVEVASPNVYADQIEWMSTRMQNRRHAIISVHTHNDRGCAVAAAELAQMAGAQRVEGTLFGNGERTGNTDLVTLAFNLFSQGIDPQLNFSDPASVVQTYMECTGMPIHPRHPYVGELVYTAFSGSHQDAISKGLNSYHRGDNTVWNIPYLPMDPRDIGRSYEAIIRINSQSGKGGAAYILENRFGYRLPRVMHPEFGGIIQKTADLKGCELTAKQVHDCFQMEYIKRDTPFSLHTLQSLGQKEQTAGDDGPISISAQVKHDNTIMQITGQGNGVLDAFAAALKQNGVPPFRLLSYDEHSLQEGSNAQAVCYIRIEVQDGGHYFGVGVDTDIARASARALVSAINRSYPKRSRRCTVAAKGVC
ncbi:MAG: 2-isopropylmalate synthase [Chitinispirillaceae bacterium]